MRRGGNSPSWRTLRGRLPAWLVRARLSLALLVARRAGLFIAADLLVLFLATVSVLMGDTGGEHRELFNGLVLVPFLLLGVPVLADSIALERRAGSLDLALTTPSPFYFERRVATFCVLMLAQAWLIMTLDWLASGLDFPILSVLVHATVAVAFLGATVLFWAVRVRGVGGVALASLATAALLGKRLFASPIVKDAPGRFFQSFAFEETQEWLIHMAVLVLVSVILFLYARRRLVRPELLLR
jgi:hypothetical protein